MAKSRYIMIGGFLGAGKTTAILRLASFLQAKGQRVGLITNDQSTDLVDTARARAQGHSVAEIAGGCFCCKFDSLVEAARELSISSSPDVFLAEPVGSCTDLRATVAYPLKQLYGDDYEIAPLSVLVDPDRCAAVLGLGNGKSFSAKVIYIYRKQLEEADVIVVHKADLLTPEARESLVAALSREFPRAKVLVASTLNGEGLETWYEELLGGDMVSTPAMEVDYDEYAEGEALLGWLNARGRLKATSEFDAGELLLGLARALESRLRSSGIEIAHLKATLAPDESPELASVSITRSGEAPYLTHLVSSPISSGQWMVNLRAEADPEILEAHVLEELSASPHRVAVEQVAAFRPGRPVPTHRLGEANAS